MGPLFNQSVLVEEVRADYERKLKHLQKQKEGKKKLKRVGNVELPAEAFYNVLSA